MATAVPQQSDSFVIMSDIQRDEDLINKHHELLLDFLPVIIVTSGLGAFGIAGNIVTFLFYRKCHQTSTTVLIAGLAVVDLLVCCLSFATSAKAAVNIMYTNKYLCKLQHTLGHFSVMASTIILWIISIDRCLKVCHPLWWQFTIKSATKILWIVITFSILASARNVLLFNILEVSFTSEGQYGINLTNASFVGYYCTVPVTENLRPLIVGFSALDALIGIGAVLTLLLSYGHIIRQLHKHSNRMKLKGIQRPCREGCIKGDEKESLSVTETSGYIFSKTDNYTTNNKGIELSTNKVLDNVDSNDEVLSTNVAAISVVHEANTKRSPKKRKRKRRKQSERNLTIMMIIISAGCIVCAVPYFVGAGIRTGDPIKYQLDPLFQLFDKTPYWNSVLNPVVFCAFNSRYRKYVRRVLRCEN